MRGFSGGGKPETNIRRIPYNGYIYFSLTSIDNQLEFKRDMYSLLSESDLKCIQPFLSILALYLIKRFNFNKFKKIL